MPSRCHLSNSLVLVHYDNQSANHVFHERTKYIDVKLYFIRDIASGWKVKVVKVSTLENPVDMMTKLVPLCKFKLYLELLKVGEG